MLPFVTGGRDGCLHGSGQQLHTLQRQSLSLAGCKVRCLCLFSGGYIRQDTFHVFCVMCVFFKGVFCLTNKRLFSDCFCVTKVNIYNIYIYI